MIEPLRDFLKRTDMSEKEFNELVEEGIVNQESVLFAVSGVLVDPEKMFSHLYGLPVSFRDRKHLSDLNRESEFALAAAGVVPVSENLSHYIPTLARTLAAINECIERVPFTGLELWAVTKAKTVLSQLLRAAVGKYEPFTRKPGAERDFGEGYEATKEEELRLFEGG